MYGDQRTHLLKIAALNISSLFLYLILFVHTNFYMWIKVRKHDVTNFMSLIFKTRKLKPHLLDT